MTRTRLDACRPKGVTVATPVEGPPLRVWTTQSRQPGRIEQLPTSPMGSVGYVRTCSLVAYVTITLHMLRYDADKLHPGGIFVHKTGQFNGPCFVSHVLWLVYRGRASGEQKEDDIRLEETKKGLCWCWRHGHRSSRKMHTGGMTDPSTNRNRLCIRPKLTGQISLESLM